MKFLTAHIENFLTLSRATVELADKGLHLIQGVNNEDDSASSNGAGKSSIVDAICWALFGVTARGVKGDSVVNRGAKKDTVVIVTVQSGATTYKVERYRKHRAGKNSLRLHAITDPGMPGVDLTKGTDAETQKDLEKILGCSYEVFVSSVYAGQEAMPDLPKMGDRDLKRLIEEAAGLQRIERAYAVSRERMNAAKGQVESVQTRMATLATSRERTEQTLVVRRERAAQWDFERQGVLDAQQARVDAAKVDATLKATAAVGRKTAADQATERMAEIAKNLASHAQLKKAADEARNAEFRAEKAIERHVLTAAVNDVKQLEHVLANAEEELKKPCPTCGVEGSLHGLDEYRAHVNTRLAAAKEKLEQSKVKVRQQIAAHQAAAEAAEAARAAVPDVTELEAERTQLQATVTAFNQAVQQAKTAKNTYDQENLSLVNLKTAVNPEAALIADLEARLVTENADMAAQQQALEEAQLQLATAETVVKVFGPAGVRAQILDTVTPYLNARTADYLSVLSDGAITATWTTLTKSATGDLKEKFSIEVESTKGSDNFAGLSGGEKRKVRLATALALQDLVASRAAQPIDLFVGDEIDDALDPSGLERLMTILERKARERGTVIVISHSDIRDWCDNVTTVTKAGQWSSTVEGSLCA